MFRLALSALGPHNGALRCVDPAAGDGALVRAALAGEDVEMTAVELDPALLDSLRGTGAEVVHADALTLARGQAPPSKAGDAFGAKAPADVPAYLRSEAWADIVLANPPYLRETGNRSVFEALRRWNDGVLRGLYRKDADLHHFFWELAIRWLRPGGVLVFLTPAYFLESEAAQPVRDLLLEEGALLGVWRSGSDRVFSDAAVEAAITVWKKGHSDAPARHMEAALELHEGLPQFVPGRNGPWWLESTPELASLAETPQTLGALYRVVEGVSTGANRLRARDVDRIENGRIGEGIFVLTDDERHSLVDAPMVRRLRADGAQREWVLMVRDGTLPRLDEGLAPETPLERHLVRFRPVLERRAEFRRNSRRSWYAVAWPRPELSEPGAIVTPKWSPRPSFSALKPGTVPMTDYRVLLPRSSQVASRKGEVLEWLQSAALRPWLEQRLKRKGAMIEFYGACLDRVPVPLDVIPA